MKSKKTNSIRNGIFKRVKYFWYIFLMLILNHITSSQFDKVINEIAAKRGIDYEAARKLFEKIFCKKVYDVPDGLLGEKLGHKIFAKAEKEGITFAEAKKTFDRKFCDEIASYPEWLLPKEIKEVDFSEFPDWLVPTEYVELLVNAERFADCGPRCMFCPDNCMCASYPQYCMRFDMTIHTKNKVADFFRNHKHKYPYLWSIAAYNSEYAFYAPRRCVGIVCSDR